MNSPSLLQDEKWALRTTSAALGLALLGSASVILGPAHGEAAVDEALDFLVGVILPVLGFMALDSIGRPSALDQTLLRFGLNRRKALMATLGRRLALFTALFTTVAGVLLVVARSLNDPALPADLWATLPVCMLSAVSVGAFFSACVLSGGRLLLGIGLAVVWLMGHADGLIAALVPVGQIRHLLALGPDLGLPAWVSALVLAFYAAVGLTVCAVRVPP